MTETIIRAATEGDLAGVLALYQHLNPNDPCPDVASAEAAWLALVQSGLTTVFVAEIGQRLVASCMLAIIPNLTRGARSFGVIENVVTHPDHRRTGLGRIILSAAVEPAPFQPERGPGSVYSAAILAWLPLMPFSTAEPKSGWTLYQCFSMRC
jgi:ribosomal protein S18 acetylase RimI-like enzyme